jgi:peptidoglycan/xylan/chitin deacetylase (PgdA/CDA1 family)
MNVIFTFDGGAKDISSRKILKILNKHNIKTTFFLTGDFVLDYPEIVREMQKGGHEIYNHTKNHPYLTKVSDREIILELDGMDRALIATIGQTSKPYFRPPYGDRNDRVLKIAYGAGYQSVAWTVDALDWQESEGRTEEEVMDIVLNSLAPGNIYLLHLGDNISGNILERLITEINNRGYNIVSLRQGL